MKQSKHNKFAVTASIFFLISASAILGYSRSFEVKRYIRDYVTQTKYAKIYKTEKVDSPFNGKTILWLGTSIPDGGYPYLVGNIINAKVYNRAKGSSRLCSPNIQEQESLLKNGESVEWMYGYSLSMSTSEKRNFWELCKKAECQINENATTDGSSKAFSNNISEWNIWEATSYDYIFKHFLHKADIVVIDHGYNDRNEIYSKMDAFDKTNFFGALRFIVETIYETKSDTKIFLVSHYTKDGSHNNENLVWDAQFDAANNLNIKFIDIATPLEINQANINEFMPDGLHPHSDNSFSTNMLIAKQIVKGLIDSER